MSKSLSTRIKASIGWTHAETLTGVNDNTQNQSSFTFSDTLADGTGADQADLIYVVSGSLAASGTLSIDLAGSVADFFGDTITMARVKTIYIQIDTASSVNVGGNANPLVNWIADGSDELIIRAGGVFLLHAPDATAYAVTASTGDVLDITNNDGSNAAAYDIAIVGASA